MVSLAVAPTLATPRLSVASWVRQLNYRVVGPMTALIALIALVSAWKMGSSPVVATDEGVYMSQAWAVSHMGSLGNYTYWYDHPPLGWIFLSGWVSATGGLARYHDSVMAGREFMVVLHVLCSMLVYIACRRLGTRRVAAGIACAAFGLSPLAVSYGRLVMLDNIAVPFVLGAFVLAFSPRRRTTAFIGAAVLFGIGVLCKETVLLLAPMLVWAIMRSVEPRRRLLVSSLSVGTLVLTVGFYPLFAVLKNELVPGDGHVSLLWAVQWQLFSRASSGSVLTPNTDARVLVDSWLNLDVWLVGAALLAVALPLSKRFGYTMFRPVAAAFAFQIIMIFRPGYLPYPYVIAVLPFAAIMVGALANGVIDLGVRQRVAEMGLFRRALTDGYRVAAAGLAAFAVMSVLIAWFQGLDAMQSERTNTALSDARSWVETNTQRGSVGVVEASLWLDLVEDGRVSPRPVWMYKLDQDPEVKASIGSWKSIDYLVIQNDTLRYESATTMPLLFDALGHSDVAARFGAGKYGYVVYVVDKTS